MKKDLVFDRTDPQAVVRAARELLRKAWKIPPAKRFEELVKLGLIDRKGRLARPPGGKADSEAGAAARAK